MKGQISYLPEDDIFVIPWPHATTAAFLRGEN
jgi:hypothetical protein